MVPDEQPGNSCSSSFLSTIHIPIFQHRRPALPSHPPCKGGSLHYYQTFRSYLNDPHLLLAGTVSTDLLTTVVLGFPPVNDDHSSIHNYRTSHSVGILPLYCRSPSGLYAFVIMVL